MESRSGSESDQAKKAGGGYGQIPAMTASSFQPPADLQPWLSQYDQLLEQVKLRHQQLQQHPNRQQNHIVQEKTKKNLATAKQTTNIEILNTIAATSSVSTMQPGHLVNPGASSSSGHSSSLPAFDQLKINLQQVTTPAKPNPGRINRSQRVQQQIALRQQIALQRDKLSRAMNRSNQSSMMAAGQNANHQPVSSFPMVANNSSPVDKSGIQIQYGSGKQSSSAPASASATGGYRGNPQSLLHSQTKFVQNQMPMPRQEQVAQRRQTMSSNPLFPPITQHISPNSSSVAKGAQIGWDETQQIQHVRNPSTSQQSLLVKTSDGVSGNPSTSCTKIVKQTPEDLAEEATQLSWFVARNDYLEKKVYRFETELSQLVSRNAYLEKRVSRLDTQLSQLVSCNAYLEKVGKMKKAEPSSVLGKKLAKIQSIKQQSSSKVEAESNYKTPPVSNLQSESEANKEEAENNVKETDPGVDLGKKMDTTQPIKQQSSPASNLPKSEAEVKEEEVDKNAKETDPGIDFGKRFDITPSMKQHCTLQQGFASDDDIGVTSESNLQSSEAEANKEVNEKEEEFSDPKEWDLQDLDGSGEKSGGDSIGEDDKSEEWVLLSFERRLDR